MWPATFQITFFNCGHNKFSAAMIGTSGLNFEKFMGLMMKTLTTAALAAVLSIGPLQAAAPKLSADTDQQLIAAARAMFNAQMKFDLRALDTILAPDYVEVSPVGGVDERTEVMSFYTPEAKAQMLAAGMEPVATLLEEPRVRVYGDQAIVISKYTTTLKIKGAEQRRSARVLFHFRKIGGKWLLQSSQFTWIKLGS